MYNNRLNTNDIDTLYRDKNNKNCVRTKTIKELRTNSYNDCERINNYEQNSVSLKKKQHTIIKIPYTYFKQIEYKVLNNAPTNLP